MDTGERLAAYLSGDLDPAERTALEAELDGDAALRARLDRIRASDDALAALEDPELPDGFSDRLRKRLAPELDTLLGDELAARRARHRRSPWVPMAGAAAVLALVVAGGIGLTTGMGGDDEEDTAATTLESGGGEADAGMAEDAPEAMAAPPAGPVVVDHGRSLTPEDLAALAEDPAVRAAMATAHVQADPEAAAQQYTSALGATLDTLADEEQATQAEDGAGAASPTGTTGNERVAASDLGEVSTEDRAAIAACVPELFEDVAFPVVPVYAEIATDADGAPVVVLAALSPDADGEYRRVEVWMLDRATCEAREWVQADPQPVDRTEP